MVLIKQIGEQQSLVKQSPLLDYSKGLQVSNRAGISVPLYKFGHKNANSNENHGGCSGFTEEHSLIDTLLLAQWEDRAAKGLLSYDVTACETKIICGRSKFIAQFIEGWNSKHSLRHVGVKDLDPSKYKMMNLNREEVLFCVAESENMTYELISSATVLSKATLIIINENPIEYGHVFIIPSAVCGFHQLLDLNSLEVAARIAVHVNNCFFQIVYDSSAASTTGNYLHFEACYFANPLPVEMVPVIPVLGDWENIELKIFEIASYPIKGLVFKCKENFKLMVSLVAEVCSRLQDQDVPHKLLITDCGTKIFLFPQGQNEAMVQGFKTGSNPSAWECVGYFVFKTKLEFDQATEESILKRLTAASLNNENFQALKQLCCFLASKMLLA
ncbi:GDP-L-galactose phosphorylase 1 isoform X2 [Amborella trichopoda]|uniref:GDP-L-galactose phosphorylase 1 isoform X2 n=1 Tax=Amborella trichopoda TaxID=13333 RepID=UPI0005D38861|nr:GDP-L-galactose phosphorylase 1 isoform X2 [Amborella trichopoda]XP_020523899.1 GDP-L-galactose phosphorylase 1 isoform X2 [Amborella trichopoda]XP_020523900.1 GDP-L-galactose phosphorylase 1 isoform X2 [Amborella trichopoda]|eukprot:XP_011624021.1 GDP-L-galactose phosphorylase 1 isoform X2 [Amborella trichopoda]